MAGVLAPLLTAQGRGGEKGDAVSPIAEWIDGADGALAGFGRRFLHDDAAIGLACAGAHHRIDEPLERFVRASRGPRRTQRAPNPLRRPVQVVSG